MVVSKIALKPLVRCCSTIGSSEDPRHTHELRRRWASRCRNHSLQAADEAIEYRRLGSSCDVAIPRRSRLTDGIQRYIDQSHEAKRLSWRCRLNRKLAVNRPTATLPCQQTLGGSNGRGNIDRATEGRGAPLRGRLAAVPAGHPRFREPRRRPAKCYDVLVDGITVDNRPGRPVISADAKDENFYAAIFGNDDDAIPDMTADELEQARHYIIRGEGVIPVRKWHMLRKSTLTPSSVVTHS